MFRLLLLAFLLFFLVFGALAVWAYNMWGFWGFVGVGLGLVVFFWLVFKLLGVALKRLFLTPFKMKAVVLKDAVVTVNSITPAGPPVIEADYDAADYDAEERRLEDRSGDGDDELNEDYDDEDEEVPDKDLDWYHLDVTITPKAGPGPFQHWEPGELMLVDVNTKGHDFEADDLGRVSGVEVWLNDGWKPDAAGKYPGPQRLRLHAGVNRGTRRARLKYYFEILEGELVLPQLS
jgi:hypothetical protein